MTRPYFSNRGRQSATEFVMTVCGMSRPTAVAKASWRSFVETSMWDRIGFTHLACGNRNGNPFRNAFHSCHRNASSLLALPPGNSLGTAGFTRHQTLRTHSKLTFAVAIHPLIRVSSLEQ